MLWIVLQSTPLTCGMMGLQDYVLSMVFKHDIQSECSKLTVGEAYPDIHKN